MKMYLSIAILTVNMIFALADRSQLDCQENEVFVQCGQCEGTCKNPVVKKCPQNCRLPRCECQLSQGFVRTHDGACIKAIDCAIYVGIEIFGDGNYKLLRDAKLKIPIPPASQPFDSAETFESVSEGGTEIKTNAGAVPPAYGPETLPDFDTSLSNKYDENNLNEFADIESSYDRIHSDYSNGAQT